MQMLKKQEYLEMWSGSLYFKVSRDWGPFAALG